MKQAILIILAMVLVFVATFGIISFISPREAPFQIRYCPQAPDSDPENEIKVFPEWSTPT